MLDSPERPSTRTAALRALRVQLEEAVAAPKCAYCGCFHDLVGALRRADGLAAEVHDALVVAERALLPRTYDCLGCSLCFPAVAVNALADAGIAPRVDACPTAPVAERPGWPPWPGDYEVLRHRAPVAVCTLDSDDLARRVTQRLPEGVAIVGSLRTENLGIERIVRNVLANPCIRFLLICGDDGESPVGHRPGQSMECLFAHGVDDRMRIIGARGKRPVLRNLRAEDVHAFLEQVELVSRVGETREDAILELAAGCVARSPGPAVSASTPVPVAVVRASDRRRLILDPAGYLVVHPDTSRHLLVVEHYSNEGVLGLVVEGESASAVWGEVVDRTLVSRLDHAAYLGRELARAERCLQTGERYVQDAAPGRSEVDREGEQCGCGASCEREAHAGRAGSTVGCSASGAGGEAPSRSSATHRPDPRSAGS